MTPDGIASLVIAILAFVLSCFSFIFANSSTKHKIAASYRKYFFEDFIKNNLLFDLAKTVTALRSNNITKENFEDIHRFATTYLKEIKFLSIVDVDTYEVLHDHLIAIDDPAVICIQRIKDSFDFSDEVKDICTNTTKFFKKLKNYYCGK